MSHYLSVSRLEHAVNELRRSRASAGMVNFLILRRALKLSGGKPIGLSLTDSFFQQAITDLAWWPLETESDEPKPFVDVFGSVNDAGAGFKRRKYRSNGPADTLKNGAWSGVVQVTAGERFKIATLRQEYLQSLPDMTLLKDESRPMPQLVDSAVWYFRRQELSSLVSATADDDEVEKALVEAFIEQVGLTAGDLMAMYTKDS